MKTFILYGTSACHLCELAQVMIEELQSTAGGFRYEEVDISDSDTLFERYGLLIPVLLHPDKRALNWPFSAGQLREFLLS